MTAPVESTHPPNQAPATLALMPMALAMYGRAIMEGMVKTEMMAMGRSALFPAPSEDERAMAAEEPQMKVAPDMIILVWRSILSQLVPIMATTTKSEGVSIHDTKSARGANGLRTEMSMLFAEKEGAKIE